MHIVDRFLPDSLLAMRLAIACAACLVLGCGDDAPRAASPAADSAADGAVPRPGDLQAGAMRPTSPPALADTALRVADRGAGAATRDGTPMRADSRGDVAIPAAPGGGTVTTTLPAGASSGLPTGGVPTPAPDHAPAPVSPGASPVPGAPAAPVAGTPHPDATPDAAARPFSVGETLTYEVRFGPIALGRASMQVLGVETVRGVPAYHTRFQVRGGNALYRVNDVYQSWIDTRSLASLRYWQDIDEGSYEPKRRYEIFPERRAFVEEGKGEQPSVALPLDEGSFLYWLRTIPLEVGKTYTFDRYFRPDRNPVTIRVLRRERIRVPAGEFDAIVVQPTIKTKGLFSEGGRAEVWFADDSTRAMLQMKSKLSIGSLSLHLRSIEHGR